MDQINVDVTLFYLARLLVYSLLTGISASLIIRLSDKILI